MDGPYGDLAPAARAEAPLAPPAAPLAEPPDSPAPAGRPPSRRRPLRLLAILLCVVALGWVGWRLLAPHPRATPHTAGGGYGRGALPPQSVGVATIGRGDIRVIENGLGTVTPLADVTVKTQINGQLVKLGFTEGQLVKAGDFLAQIDPRPYQVALEQAQAALARDTATLKGAQVDLARYRKLWAQDSIAQQVLDQQAALVGTDEGTVQTDKASIDSAKLNLVYCHITSPVTGRVGLRQVDPGNYVQTSDTNGIVVVTQLQPISVLFSLPEQAIPRVLRRLHAGDAMPVQAWDQADTAQIAVGTLATIDNQVDTTTGTVKLRAVFPNDDEALFPSQFVNAKLLVDTLHDVVVAPAAAIQRGEPGTFVYVVGAGNVVRVRPVKLGPQDGLSVQVVSGLQGGERVVVDGADRLRDGAKVMVPQGGAGAGGAGEAGPGDGRARHHRHARDQSRDQAGDQGGGKDGGGAAP